MKQQFLILVSFILLMLFAQASRWFVEAPVYPVPTCHPLAVFAAAIAAFFCTGLGELRRSYALWASGLAFTYLTGAMAFYPDLWLRQPLATLGGLVITQAGALVISPKSTSAAPTMLLVALLVSAIAMIPLISSVYYTLPPAMEVYVVATLMVLLACAGWISWHRRQRRFNIVTLVTLAFWLLLVSSLFTAFLMPERNTAPNRILFVELLLTTLLTIGGIYVLDQLLSERQLRSHRHRELQVSMRDPLTNVANRRALEAYGPVMVNESRNAGRPISILMADIDHFKQVNDTYGHQAGDLVLRKAAEKLMEVVRQSDMVARYGGEEFVILLPGSPLAPALRLAERIRASVEKSPTTHEGQVISPTISIGVATAFPEEPTTLMDLVKRADENLYRAKRKGRNRVCADELPEADF